MPAVGYLGFVFFALEAVAFLRLLGSGQSFNRWRWTACLGALVFSVFTFVLIDRATVFSWTTPVRDLTFLDSADRAILESQGAGTSYAVDREALSRQERDWLDLMHLKGLGFENVMKLRRYGVDSIDKVARLDAVQFSSMIGDRNMRRARVYVGTAKRTVK